MIYEIISNLISVFLTFCITILSLFLYYKYIYKRESSDHNKTELSLFLKSFLVNFLLEKVDMEMFNEQMGRTSIKIEGVESANLIQNKSNPDEAQNKIKAVSNVDIKNIDEDKIMYRSSKNYGKDLNFSVRTWFGVNYAKLKESDFRYICFNIKGVRKIYFDSNEFTHLIDTEITGTEKNKYTGRSSIDVYLMKFNEDNKWYITRLGMNLVDPIEIVE
ncbi:hypothetical protein [Dellaglioa algida]|uniref:hypothetical protein n=1 Tax=Dellaglioa algida TaxID=105612 RepID=UPI0024C48B10|nr:hypothetical protein [Dellaglioa algida]MDK1725900.1 hypothetical protein [Dellaglioa algida]